MIFERKRNKFLRLEIGETHVNLILEHSNNLHLAFRVGSEDVRKYLISSFSENNDRFRSLASQTENFIFTLPHASLFSAAFGFSFASLLFHVLCIALGRKA